MTVGRFGTALVVTLAFLVTGCPEERTLGSVTMSAIVSCDLFEVLDTYEFDHDDIVVTIECGEPGQVPADLTIDWQSDDLAVGYRDYLPNRELDDMFQAPLCGGQLVVYGTRSGPDSARAFELFYRGAGDALADRTVPRSQRPCL